MRIGVDIMGGDFAPEATTLGAILAHDELFSSGVELVLIGDEVKIKDLLERESFDASNFEIVNSAEVIEMGDHPAKAFAQKPDSSIAIGFKLLKEGAIDGFASAGNTGAMMVGSVYTVKLIPGIIRPCITASLPKPSGGHCILLDVGLNPDCKPDVLYQYGILGSLYAEHVFNVKNPKVGLLNIGSEEEKGSLLSRATHELMKDSDDFSFIGNVEGNEIFDEDKSNVLVCDGFTGNIVLKEAEAFYSLIKSRNIKDEYFERFNFENYGGSPILGIDSSVVIGHGISNAKAIKSMIFLTKEVAEAALSEKIKEAFK